MITFVDTLKGKIQYYLRNNKLTNKNVKITDNKIALFSDNYCFYDDYFEFINGSETAQVYYNAVNRVTGDREHSSIEIINYKTYSLTGEQAFVFVDILKDILQSRDNIFHILKMNDHFSDKLSLKLVKNNDKKIEVSDAKENQIQMALLIEAKRFDEARNLLRSINSRQPQSVTDYFSSYLQNIEAKFESKPFLYYDALIPALRVVKEERSNPFALKNLIDRYVDYQGNFFEIPQDRRKFVVITDEFYGVPKKGFLMLLKNYNLEDTHPLYHSVDTSLINLPEEMSFPVGHPIVNNVYVVHPYNDKFYIPVEDHEEYLFNDRIGEFKTLVQAFGATEVKFSKEHRLKVNRDQSHNLDVNVDIGAKVHGAKVGYSNSQEQNFYNNNELSYETSQRFEPRLRPYIPENLVWYPRETVWQRMFMQRKGGNNLLGIEEVISSKSHKTVFSNEITDINVGLKMFFVTADVHVKKEIKSSISEEEEMVQKISVTFASVNELTEDYVEKKLSIDEYSTAKISYKNRNTELVPMVFLENRTPKPIPPVLGKNIRIPISEEHNLYLEMIYVEGGAYWMGTDDPEALEYSPSSTLKQVTVDSFYISKYTITRQQHTRIVKNLFGHPANSPQWLTKEMLENNDFFESFITRLNENTKLQFIIPNNHQWEYAARGGKHSKGYKYAGSNNILEVAWMSQSEAPSLSGVGMKKPNELGIHDMSGNIYELVNDIEFMGYSLRGGGYWSKSKFCTVYHKINFKDSKNSTIESLLKDTIEGRAVMGFRVVLPISEIEKLEIVENKEQLVKIKK